MDSKLVIEKALSIAEKFIGQTERIQNRGLFVDIVLAEFGMCPKDRTIEGPAYCALYAQYPYKLILDNKFPFIITASSQTLFEEAKSKDWITNTPKRGDIVIWRKFKLWQGHAGLIEMEYPGSKIIDTYEGNTFPDNKGDQRAGNGFYMKKRGYGLADWQLDAFYLRGFIDMTKAIESII